MSATVTTSVIDSITEDRCAELLTELIRQRSVVGEETTAHSWMADRLRDAGMRVEVELAKIGMPQAGKTAD